MPGACCAGGNARKVWALHRRARRRPVRPPRNPDLAVSDIGVVNVTTAEAMTKGWQLAVSTTRPGHADPVVEHFIVAIFDQDQAIETLRKRNKLEDAKVLAFGPAPELTMAFLNAQRGEVYSVSVVKRP